MARIFTTQQIADMLGQPLWRIQRLYEDGTVPESGRFAGKRMIPSTDLPRIIDALRARAWLPAAGEPHSATQATREKESALISP